VEPSDTPQHPGQPNFQIHEVPVDPSLMLDSPREPLLDEPHALPNTGNSNIKHLFPVIHCIHTSHADARRTVPPLDVRPKELDFEVAARRIDEIAKVI